MKKLFFIWLPGLIVLLFVALLRNNWFIQLNALMQQGTYDYITNSSAPQWMLNWQFTSLSTLKWLLLGVFLTLFYGLTSLLLGFGWTHNYLLAFKQVGLVYTATLVLAIGIQLADSLLFKGSAYAFTRSLLGFLQSPFVYIGFLVYKEGLAAFYNKPN